MSDVTARYGQTLVSIRERGVITIPSFVRERLHLEVGDNLALTVEDGRIVLTPVDIVRRDLPPEPGDDIPIPSVLAGLPAFAWDSTQSVAYEVAIEAIAQATAAYTVLIEQAEQVGDTDAATRLTAQQAECIRDRETLRSTDAAAVGALTSRYRTLIDTLRARAR